MKTLIFFITLIISLSIISCEKEEIEFSKTNYKVLFISRRIENSSAWNLILMNNDGTNQIKLIDKTVRCGKPVISNLGNMVLFVHYTDDFFYELYKINIDGTNLTLIDRSKRFCGCAAWSSDDTKFIYSKSRNDSTDDKDLIIYHIDSKEKEILISKMNNVSAKFSKNDQIVYCEQKGFSSDIYSINTDGSHKQKIIENAYSPVWSPDGKKIAYISMGDERRPQIFVSNPDGSDSNQLTFRYLNSRDSGFPSYGNTNPQWTPDGKKIVYESGINEGIPQIYIMNNDGSNKVRLTYTDTGNEDPEISKDGRFIVFSSYRELNSNSEIFVMDIFGNNQYSISNYSGDDCFPVIVRE